jgi:DNA-directed RNA polymerase subunit F
MFLFVFGGLLVCFGQAPKFQIGGTTMVQNEMTLSDAIKALEDFFFQFAYYAWGSYEGELTSRAKEALDYLRAFQNLLEGTSNEVREQTVEVID